MGKSGIDTARELAGQEGGLGRIPTGWQKYLISGIAVTWSLFQLALPQAILLDTIYIRAIHLAFAMTLVFLNYPLLKKPIPGMRSGMRYFSSRKTVPFIDMVFAGAACFAALYLVIFLDAVNNRQAPPVGLAAYAAAIAGSPPVRTGLQGFMYDIRTAILPFMFIFNTELILHNVFSWPRGILIFAMACMGNFAFASATQGWFYGKNKFWEIPLFLSVTFVLMQPQRIAQWIGLGYDQRYWCYLIGLTLFGLIFLMQRARGTGDGFQLVGQG